MFDATFSCSSCGTSFRMKYEYLKDKSEIVCPTCGNKVPDEILGYSTFVVVCSLISIISFFAM